MGWDGGWARDREKWRWGLSCDLLSGWDWRNVIKLFILPSRNLFLQIISARLGVVAADGGGGGCGETEGLSDVMDREDKPRLHTPSTTDIIFPKWTAGDAELGLQVARPSLGEQGFCSMPARRATHELKTSFVRFFSFSFQPFPVLHPCFPIQV